MVLGAIVGLVILAGCSRDSDYSQSTPDAVIKTAKLMVERGQAKRLHELFYAENDDMRGLLRRIGVMLGHLQDLGSALNTAFPEELAKLKAQAEDATKKGKTTSLLSQLSRSSNMMGRNRKPPTEKEQREQQELISSAFKRLFADPYGFLNENAGHLTTVEISDDAAAIQWDGQPVLAPVGLTMKRYTAAEGTRWGVVLPLNLPFIAKYAPRTRDEYKILGSLVRTFDNVLVDLTKDIRAKQIKGLDQVSRKAGEKLFVPAVMTVYAYGKAVDARKKQDAAAKPPSGSPPAEGGKK